MESLIKIPMIPTARDLSNAIRVANRKGGLRNSEVSHLINVVDSIPKGAHIRFVCVLGDSRYRVTEYERLVSGAWEVKSSYMTELKDIKKEPYSTSANSHVVAINLLSSFRNIESFNKELFVWREETEAQTIAQVP